jgi:hypothetical protein
VVPRGRLWQRDTFVSFVIFVVQDTV